MIQTFETRVRKSSSGSKRKRRQLRYGSDGDREIADANKNRTPEDGNGKRMRTSKTIRIQFKRR